MNARYTIAGSLALLSTLLSAQDLDSLCLPTSAGRFWSTADGVIQAWTLSGGTISGGATVLTGDADMNSLAFCSASGPTSFYGNHTSNGIQYYSGGSWVFVGIANYIYNHGGSGAHLYFVDVNNDLWHFGGTPPATLIASPPSGYWFSSDIVCDGDGNAYVSYGPTGIGVPATEFRKYDPAGNVLDSWSTTHVPTNGWGAFMLGNTIHIAFGPSNPTWPHKLVPFTLGAGSAVTVGTPITFVQGGMFDLASCMEADLTAVPETAAAADPLVILPAPASTLATVLLPPSAAITAGHVHLVDLNGRHLSPPIVRSEGGLVIDVSSIADGLYVMAVTDASGTMRTGRLVVQH